MKPRVQPFFDPASHTWSYVVSEPSGNAAAVIDPVLAFDAGSGAIEPGPARVLLEHVRTHGLDVGWILETHAHADHLSAARWLQAYWPHAQVAIGAGIRDVQRTFAAGQAGDDALASDGAQFDRLLETGDVFAIGALTARTLAVPGHTPDSVAYLIGDALFTGDSLFMPDAGTARCDFPGGDAATLYRSIRQLFDTLPDATRVFVCHDYGPGGREVACETTLGAQRRDNIHLHDGISEADYVAQRRARDATLALPALIEPSLHVNLRGGRLPEADADGTRLFKLPAARP